MPAEADLLCDYYMATNLKGAKKPSQMTNLNSKLSDSLSSLSSLSSTSTSSSSLCESIDFIKYEKNPMDLLKKKYPVLNAQEPHSNHKQPSATKHTKEEPKQTITTVSTNNSSIETNWSKIKKTGVGLLNIGNNCYLNATLQCLAYTPPLSQWLIGKPHSNSCRFKQLKGFCSLCEVEKIIFDIFNSCNGCAKPNQLCFNIKKISNVFGVGRQEDASEFFTTLIESMNKTINFSSNSAQTKHSQNGFNNKHNNRNNSNNSPSKQRSILDEIFSFQFRSRVTCCNCGRLSDTVENTNTWPVDVKYVKDLQKGMLHFLREEVLDGENAYKCDKCNKKTRATKKYSIRTAPNVLVVHLKRFDFSHAGKLSHFVTYPETLSLKNLINDTTPLSNGNCSNNEQKMLKNATYKLYGVLVHLGHTSKSGHYYSYVRGPNNSWYKADDTRICTVQEKDAMGQNAYILFYKRIQSNLKAQTLESTINQPIIQQHKLLSVNDNNHNKPADAIKETVSVLSQAIAFSKTNGHIPQALNGDHTKLQNGHGLKTTNGDCLKLTNGHSSNPVNSDSNAPTNGHTNGHTNGDVKLNKLNETLNDKILKKERLIIKLSKKLKKKELKRLRKKLTRLESKVSQNSDKIVTDNSKNPELIFANKKRELRLLKKLINKRKLKRLNDPLVDKSKPQDEEITNIKEANLPKTSESLKETNNKSDLTKPFDLNLLTNGHKNGIKTWNNEDSSLLKSDKNKFDNLSEEEHDDYNEEFDKPKIREKILKKKNGFHQMTHQQNGASWKHNDNNHSFKNKNFNNGNQRFNNQNGSYKYNNNNSNHK